MSAEIIKLSAARAERRDGDSGNGAREALISAARGHAGRNQSDAELLADWLLLELAMRGFIVVPADFD